MLYSLSLLQQNMFNRVLIAVLQLSLISIVIIIITNESYYSAVSYKKKFVKTLRQKNRIIEVLRSQISQFN